MKGKRNGKGERDGDGERAETNIMKESDEEDISF